MHQSSLQKKPHNQGFTLIETLVAITILLLVIIGPISIAAKGLQMSYYAGDELAAIYLAQEVIEAVTHFRDKTALEVLDAGSGETDEWLTDRGSDNELSPCFVSSSGSAGCELTDVVDNEYGNCSGAADSCRLRFDPVSKTYNYGGSGGVSTGFKRELRLYTLTDNTILMEVIVSWNANPGLFTTERRVVLQTFLYDHYNHFE